MSDVFSLTLSPFAENTYIVGNKSAEAIIFDPGCYDQKEEQQLFDLIEREKLSIKYLINTHCHLDHVFGNKACIDLYQCPFLMHEGELPVLKSSVVAANMYGLQITPSPDPTGFLEEGDQLVLGELVFEILLTPGHSPASLCFYNRTEGYVIGGDVLFRESIGRTDLPGGDHETLLTSIRDKLYVLPDETVIYPGHGEPTTIGYEKRHNPFMR